MEGYDIYDFLFTIFSFYNTEDCHGPSGLAVTFVSMLFCDFCAFCGYEPNLKKQSQFLKGQISLSTYIRMDYIKIYGWSFGENKANLFVLSAACRVLRDRD